jgi:nucleoid DNA-binding protein
MSRNMVTKALAEEVKAAMGSSASVDEVRNICENFLTVILDKVKGGEEVTLTNFLKIKRVVNKERTFKIPRTENTTTKPERYGISVKVMAGTKSAFEALPIGESDAEKEPEPEVPEVEVAPKLEKKAPAPAPKGKGKKAPEPEKEPESDKESDIEEKPKKKAPAKKKTKASDCDEPKKKAAPKKTKKAKSDEEEDVLEREETGMNAWTFEDDE